MKRGRPKKSESVGTDAPRLGDVTDSLPKTFISWKDWKKCMLMCNRANRMIPVKTINKKNSDYFWNMYVAQTEKPTMEEINYGDTDE